MDNQRYESFLKEFGKHLRKIRKDKGLTMEELAYKTEIEYRQLGRIERGEINTSIVTSLRLAEALEVELKVLFSI